MPGLYPFEPKQQPFKLVLPGEGSFHGQAKLMNGCIKKPFPAALGFLPVSFVFRNIGDHAAVEYMLSILSGIKRPVKIEHGTLY